MTDKRHGHAGLGTVPNPQAGFNHIPNACAIRTATIKYPKKYEIGRGGSSRIS